jgi:hypothetical protein
MGRIDARNRLIGKLPQALGIYPAATGEAGVGIDALAGGIEQHLVAPRKLFQLMPGMDQLKGLEQFR